ncbi:MAG: hypothetical protein BWY64_04091 [bacterium ADurb.Bin363]|nr:MAG: hypothetical protein BWY64_04091 [bacterium ADurb.Bin363]
MNFRIYISHGHGYENALIRDNEVEARCEAIDYSRKDDVEKVMLIKHTFGDEVIYLQYNNNFDYSKLRDKEDKAKVKVLERKNSNGNKGKSKHRR